MAAIRDAGEDDWQLLRAIRLRALLDAPRAFTAEYEDEADHDERRWRERLRSQHWLLAFRDGLPAEPVGMVAATRESVALAEEPFINSLWVDPYHRRRGVARLCHPGDSRPRVGQRSGGGLALGPRR